MTVTAPGRSNVLAPFSARLSTSVRGARNAAMSPIGTLTNSTQRQLRPLVRIPPSSTPAAPPAPATAPQIPSARLRSEPSANVVVMIDSAAGETIAAPSPCTARATISQPSDWAIPPANEATENSTSPSMNMRLRPSRSESRPPSSRKPPKVSVYAFTTHDRLVREKWSAAPIDGSATFTIDASITITNCTIASSSSARFLARGVYSGGVWGVLSDVMEADLRFRLRSGL